MARTSRSLFPVSATLARLALFASIATLTAVVGAIDERPQSDTPLPLTLENIFRGGRGGASAPSISPDGKWVTFNAQTKSGRGVHRMQMASGQPGAAQFWIEGAGVEWAPDSQSVVVTRGERLWRAGLGDQTPKALTPTVKGIRAPSFSPTASASRSSRPRAVTRTSGSFRPKAASRSNSRRKRCPRTTAASASPGRRTAGPSRTSPTRPTTGWTTCGSSMSRAARPVSCRMASPTSVRQCPGHRAVIGWLFSVRRRRTTGTSTSPTSSWSIRRPAPRRR